MLDYRDVLQLMKDFDFDFINKNNELIMDYETNTYTSINPENDFDDLLWRVVFNLCRPIGKGLKPQDSKRMMHNFNNYFKTNLVKSDFILMYQELCNIRKEKEFKDFIKRGFPMDELRGKENE